MSPAPNLRDLVIEWAEARYTVNSICRVIGYGHHRTEIEIDDWGVSLVVKSDRVIVRVRNPDFESKDIYKDIIKVKAADPRCFEKLESTINNQRKFRGR